VRLAGSVGAAVTALHWSLWREIWDRWIERVAGKTLRGGPTNGEGNAEYAVTYCYDLIRFRFRLSNWLFDNWTCINTFIIFFSLE
jgi:hypothetical protein